MDINVIEDVLQNLNTWIVVFSTGLFVWMLRQAIPDAIEQSKTWKILLRLIPMFVGISIAVIPGLRPVPDNVMQSGAIGFIGGSFSQSAYDLLKSTLSNKMKIIIGSKKKGKF